MIAQSGASGRCVQPRGQSSAISARSVKAPQDVRRIDVAEPERAHAGGVDDPARCRRRRRSAARPSTIDVCRPRPVTTLTCPVARCASGTRAFTSVDLPTPEWPTNTVECPTSAAPIRSSGISSLRAGEDVEVEPVEVREELGRIGEVGLGHDEQRADAGVERRDEVAVDEARARLGVGGGDDDEHLVGVRDDDRARPGRCRRRCGAAATCAPRCRRCARACPPSPVRRRRRRRGRRSRSASCAARAPAPRAPCARPGRPRRPARCSGRGRRRAPGRSRRRRARAGAWCAAGWPWDWGGRARRTRRTRVSSSSSSSSQLTDARIASGCRAPGGAVGVAACAARARGTAAGSSRSCRCRRPRRPRPRGR